MEKVLVRPFDIVTTDEGAIGMVTETDGRQASVAWFFNPCHQHNAWWVFWGDYNVDTNIHIIGNAMEVITNAMAHPFGGNTHQANFFGFKKD